MIASKTGNLFGLVPDEFNRLADDGADGVIRVVVAIRARELDHAEFHMRILAHLEEALPVSVLTGGASISRLSEPRREAPTLGSFGLVCAGLVLCGVRRPSRACWLGVRGQ